MLNADLYLKKEINLDINLTAMTMESDHISCVNCGHKTERIFKHRQNQKGIIGVYFSNKEGPIICVTYKRECKKCNIIYHKGYYQNDNGDQVFESLAHSVAYHITDYTYFDTQLFDELNLWQLTDGVGFSSFTDKYNNRFKEEIEHTSLILSNLNQNIGKRNSTKPSLVATRLQDAYYFYYVQKYIENEKQNFTITQKMFEKANKIQEMKIAIKIMQPS